MAGKTTNTSSETEELKKLIDIVSLLRSPSKGCPWDLEQTHLSLIPYLLEESHEVVDAIRNKNDKDIKEELGDLLLQIVLHAQIAQEEQRFSLEDIAQSINQKLIRRHPHVFGKKKLKTIDEVEKSWDSIKFAEQSSTTSTSPLCDQLREKARSQPAIAGAMAISKKTAKVGFEWKNIEDVWEKVNEELQELKDALDKNNLSNAQEELGDVIFTLINIARWYKLSPEEAVSGTNKRFLDRFSYIESTLGGDFHKYSINEFKKLWKAAKEDIKNKKLRK